MMRTSGTERLLAVLRASSPLPPRDDATHELVRAKLALVSSRPDVIRVSVDRSCVVLTGPVPRSERARIVRSLARVRGVDSIVDLLAEHPDTSVTTRPSRRPARAILVVAGGLLVGALLALASRARR